MSIPVLLSASGAPAAATSLPLTPKTVLNPLLMLPALLPHASAQLSFFFLSFFKGRIRTNLNVAMIWKLLRRRAGDLTFELDFSLEAPLRL